MEMHWWTGSFSDLNKKDLYNIMHLRQLVFVVEQDCPYIDADGKDQEATHILGYLGDNLLAYSRILPPGISYQDAPAIGRVVTHPEYRAKGIGKALMKRSMAVLAELYPDSDCRISAQTYLLDFYRQFGFEVCSNEYLEDGLPHHEMLYKS